MEVEAQSQFRGALTRLHNRSSSRVEQDAQAAQPCGQEAVLFVELYQGCTLAEPVGSQVSSVQPCAVCVQQLAQPAAAGERQPRVAALSTV
jgi:hypothetical protein